MLHTMPHDFTYDCGQGQQNFQKYVSHLHNVGTWSITQSKIHTENPQTLYATLHN